MSSFQTAVSPSRRAGTRFISVVRRALQKALVEEAKKSNMTQADIARRIGVHRSVIHRELRGVENLTLRRVGELVWAMGKVPEFAVRDPVVVSGANDSPSVQRQPTGYAQGAVAMATSMTASGSQSVQGAVNASD